ncbi:MAG: hypothetical protein OJF50_006251 [Nitrospira sp.]|jgi:hypothetical protein|nr:hypothetical protein [Nitrospira sp.]
MRQGMQLCQSVRRGATPLPQTDRPSMGERSVGNHPAPRYTAPLYGGLLILCCAVTTLAEDVPSLLPVPTERTLASEKPLGDPIGRLVMGWGTVECRCPSPSPLPTEERGRVRGEGRDEGGIARRVLNYEF